MPMDQVECLVIGAGVVGLAVARSLARRGREVVVAEAATLIGSETSSRNSEVIHAGIYYPAGSLKRSEEHTSELQSLMRISYAVFCLNQKQLRTLHTTIKKQI